MLVFNSIKKRREKKIGRKKRPEQFKQEKNSESGYRKEFRWKRRKKTIQQFESYSVRVTRSKSNAAVEKKNESISLDLPHAKSIVKKNVIVERINFIKLDEYKENCLILAKQKYSVPWPARILKITKEKILVYFLGDKREGSVLPQEIYDFQKSSKALKSLVASKRKHRGYLTGIREIELLLGISEEQSVLNQI